MNLVSMLIEMLLLLLLVVVVVKVKWSPDELLTLRGLTDRWQCVWRDQPGFPVGEGVISA